MNKTSYQMVCQSRESLLGEAKTMALWIEELHQADRCWVDDREDALIDNEVMNNFVLHEEPSVGPTGYYVTPSEVKTLMKDNIKATAEVATGRVVNEIEEETIEHACTVGYDEQKEVIRTPIRNVVEGNFDWHCRTKSLKHLLSAEWITWPNLPTLLTPWSNELGAVRPILCQ